ncbi:MAG TPA: FAD-dependent oxidoreductase [Gemmatimonadales bacterium]|nr:FAD-dependent oxidoreductase [Gemmatimonadales bacterium]
MTAAPAPATEVLVVGAGPAGSATALRLARAGVAVTLVDRAAFPRDKACAEYMSPETVRQLDLLGVLPALDAAGGHALVGTDLTAARGARLAGRFALASPRPFRPTGLSLARRVLDVTLLDAARAAGVTVLERAAVEELLYERGAVAGALVRLDDGARRAVRARLTIGADGLRSVVARRLGGVRHGWPRRLGLVAHVADVADLGPSAEMHVGRAGYVGLNPIGGGLANVALVVPAARAAALRGRAADFFFETLETFPGVAGRIARARAVDAPRATGPFAQRATRVVADGALLVGDAAEFFDPFTGEGICTALRGAALAAEVAAAALRDGPGTIASARRLDGYRALRRQAFAGKWAVERLVGWAMEWPALFDRAVGRLGRRPAMAHTFIGVTGDFVPARAVLDPRFLARLVL